jgi:hypothetical protein
MDKTAVVRGEEFIGRVAPLMVRLFCLSGEQQKGTMAALLGAIEERLESFESLNRDKFIALFQSTLDNEERAESCQDATTFRAGKAI